MPQHRGAERPISVALVWWELFENMEDLAGYFLQALRYLWAFVKFSFL
jgi:hypothetical protein